MLCINLFWFWLAMISPYAALLVVLSKYPWDEIREHLTFSEGGFGRALLFGVVLAIALLFLPLLA